MFTARFPLWLVKESLTLRKEGAYDVELTSGPSASNTYLGDELAVSYCSLTYGKTGIGRCQVSRLFTK